jgi:hypothetical protein
MGSRRYCIQLHTPKGGRGVRGSSLWLSVVKQHRQESHPGHTIPTVTADTSSLAEAIAVAYGIGTPATGLAPIARGEQGSVWRLNTRQGSYAVKEAFEPQNEADAALDVSFQESVLAATNVRLPRPRRTTRGTVLTIAAARQFRVYEWVDLLPADPGFDPAIVGATIAAIHRVRHDPAPPLHPWYTEPVGVSKWYELSGQVTASGAPFADAFAAELPMLVSLEALLVPPKDLQNCHRDLFADNVLPLAKGGLAVIDWENCGLEDPSHELGAAMFDFTVGEPARSRRLYDAYVEAGGPGRLTGRGSFSMLIVQFGHFFEKAARQWLDPLSSDEGKEHAMARFEELFTNPLTIDRIDEFLDSANG